MQRKTMTSSHLTPGQRALIKAQLELRLHQLDRQLGAHHEGVSRVEHARDMLQQDGDDAPQRAADREVDLALSDLETQELGAVSRALKRIDDEGFGLCASCGAGIPFDRLKIEPHAMWCVACAARKESTTTTRRA
jgi:DnaK suppressor protein